MTYRISGLSPEPFKHLYGFDDAGLATHCALRLSADAGGMPDRVELRDARQGEHVLLLNHVHHAANTPFRASHAIYVIEGAEAATVLIDEVPEVMRRRLLSIRAFDDQGMMIDADVVEGIGADALIERLFSNPTTTFLHAHYARMGCYAALVERHP